MIDPAIIDLIHHLGQQPPAVVRPFETNKAPSENDTEPHVRQVEQWSENWILVAQKQVEKLTRDFEEDPENAKGFIELDRAIKLIDELLLEDAKAFKKQQKVASRLQKQVKSTLPQSFQRFNSERVRNFRAISRVYFAKAELGFALKALRAKYEPRSKEGPVFDNAKTLGDYLRSAIA